MDGSFPWVPAVLLSEQGSLPAESARTFEELLRTVQTSVVPVMRIAGSIGKHHLGLTDTVWRQARTQRIAFAVALSDDLRRDEKFQLTWSDVMARGPDFIAEHLEKSDAVHDGSARRIANILRATTTDLGPFALAVGKANLVDVLTIFDLNEHFTAVMDAATDLDLALLAGIELGKTDRGGTELHEVIHGTEDIAARYQDAVGQLVVELLDQQGNPPDRTLPASLHLPDGWTLDHRPAVSVSVRGWVHGGG